MRKIPMYDFPKEYELNRQRYADAFDKVCRTGHFAGGEFSAAFEKDFAAFLGASVRVIGEYVCKNYTETKKRPRYGIADELL